MEETQPITPEEELVLDAIARALILAAKQQIQAELNEKINEQESK